MNKGTSPHMQYNYQYYVNKTLDAYPDTEVLVVRTEHQWEDLIVVDKLVGGTGDFSRLGQGSQMSHGSSKYFSSPLSDKGYQKLCCALVTEVEVYARVLEKAANLNPESRQQSLQDLYDSCHISNWNEWTTQCKAKLLEDDEILEQQNAASFLAEMPTHLQNQNWKIKQSKRNGIFKTPAPPKL